MRRLRAAVIVGSLGVAMSPWFGVTAAHAGASVDVGISKTHTGNFTVGQNGTFTITLHDNSGNATGTDTFTVTDTLPTGLTYVSDTGSNAGLTCTHSGQTVTCTGEPNVPANGDKSFTLTVAVANAARPTATNQVSFTEEFNADNNPDNDSDSDTVTVDPAASPSASPTPAPTHTTTVSPSATPAVAGESGEQLPTTGVPLGWLVAFALALVALGAGGFVAVRTSRRAH